LSKQSPLDQCARERGLAEGEIRAAAAKDSLAGVRVGSSERKRVNSAQTAGGLPGLERVVAEPEALALYVEDGASSIAEIVRRLDRDGIRVGAITVSRPTLDDVFLSATGRRLEGQEQQSQQPAAVAS
jgi:ABC-type multidrug transport system ATPase subunit